MRKLPFLIIILFPLFATAQTDSISPDTFQHVIFEIPAEMPSYPGGDEALEKFIYDNLIYPDSALKKGLKGTVTVKLLIDTDGKVRDAIIHKTFDKSCGEEALRVVKLTKWVPAKDNGKPVSTWVIIPVKFKLD